MNKKAQYVQNPSGPFGNVHPVLIIGVVIFVVPFFGPIIHLNIPTWINGVGVVVIILGAILSILKASQD